MRVKLRYCQLIFVTIVFVILTYRRIQPITKMRRKFLPRRSIRLASNFSQFNASLVLVLAYLRGGSTFTADILQQADDSFYAFEPMAHFVERFKLKPLLWCKDSEVLAPECSDSMTNDLGIQHIEQFYRCNFSSSFLWPEVPKYKSVGRSYTQQELGKCLRSRRRRKISKENCYEMARKQCSASKIRLIKTIRISMEMTKVLLEKLPDLKIIHVLRDPRGMIDSRVTLIRRDLKNVFLLSANDICNRCLRDVRVARMLNVQFPNRIKTVKYEDIADNPHKISKQLYDFLGLEFTPRLQKWISDHTKSNKSSDYFGTTRTNSSQVARKWKTSLPLNVIREIDQWCVPFYKSVGYKVYPHRESR